MKRSYLYSIWAALFVLCAALGFIPEPEGALRVLLTLIALAFFIPPLLLIREGHKPTLKLLRYLSIGSLSLTVVLLILNFLSIAGSEELGDLMYSLLIVVSSPMICCGHWVLSMFCWALVLFGSIQAGKKAA